MSDNKFKDGQGRWRTQSLFLEASYSEHALYTMKAEDHQGLPSFRRLYIEIGDPTEHRQAEELVGGWEHWQVLCSARWFQEYIEEIREELEVKLRSDAAITAIQIMKAKGKSSLTAAKMIFEGAWKEKKGRGRPSNAEIEDEARKQAKIRKRLKEDAERVALHVVGEE